MHRIRTTLIFENDCRDTHFYIDSTTKQSHQLYFLVSTDEISTLYLKLPTFCQFVGVVQINDTMCLISIRQILLTRTPKLKVIYQLANVLCHSVMYNVQLCWSYNLFLRLRTPNDIVGPHKPSHAVRLDVFMYAGSDVAFTVSFSHSVSMLLSSRSNAKCPDKTTTVTSFRFVEMT